MAKQEEKIKKIIFTAILMAIGLFLLKYLPMEKFGEEILFDASGHLTIVIFFLYLTYFFIDQNKSWRTPYFIFSLSVITIVSLQRIIDNAHNDIGLLTGLLISGISIIIPYWKKIKNKIKF